MYLNEKELDEFFLPFFNKIRVGKKFTLSDLIGSFDMVMRAMPNKAEIEYTLSKLMQHNNLHHLGNHVYIFTDIKSDMEAIDITDEEFKNAQNEYSETFWKAYSELHKNT